ncbi:hypothetical protein GF324_02725 [bacterium]|nr:hypothetical protein [bacterium]
MDADLDRIHLQHEALRDIAKTLRQGLTGTDLLKACVRSIAGALGTSSCALVLHSTNDSSEYGLDFIAVGRQFAGHEKDIDALLLSPETREKPYGRLQNLGGLNLPANGLYSLLPFHGDRTGIMVVGNRLGNRSYEDQEVGLFRLAAAQIALLIEMEASRKRERDLVHNLRREALRLSFLHEISLYLGELADPDELADRLLGFLTGIIDVRAAFIVLPGKRRGWRVAGEFGLLVPEEKVLKSRQVREVLRGNREKVMVTGKHTVFGNHGHRQTLLLRLGQMDRTLGLIGVCDRESRRGLTEFNEMDVSTLEAIAAQMSVSLNNANLYSELLNEKLFIDSVLASIPTAVLSTDQAGRLRSFNPYAEGHFGFTTEHLRQSWSKVVAGSRCRIGGYTRDEALQTPAGNLYADVSISPLIDHEARQTGRLITMKDLSEEHRIRDMFSKYVAESVVDVLLKDVNAVKLGGEERHLTVLFSDLRGFTSMSERMTPLDVVSTLNAYFDVMVGIVLKYRGTIDKLVGDEIMAVFGAPLSFRDDADRAVACAKDMIDAMGEVNELLASKDLPALHVGIGINTGTAVSGNIGSSRHMDYTVIGDTVNLASRLCDKAGPGEILLSESTYHSLHHPPALQEQRFLSVKGKVREIPTFVL